MKVIKLDGRYAGYPKWKYALQFRKGRSQYSWDQEYYRVREVVESIHGPATATNPESKTNIWAPYWLYNENWFIDSKHRRILLKNQADITMITLKLPG